MKISIFKNNFRKSRRKPENLKCTLKKKGFDSSKHIRYNHLVVYNVISRGQGLQGQSYKKVDKPTWHVKKGKMRMCYFLVIWIK